MGCFPTSGARFNKFRKCNLVNCTFYKGLPISMVHVFYIVIIEGKKSALSLSYLAEEFENVHTLHNHTHVTAHWNWKG